MMGASAPAGTSRKLLDGVLRLASPLLRRTGQLRVLAYHTVPDPRPFREQLGHLGRHYRVVDARDVLAALGGAPLPRRAVWITFDDGDPTVLANGLPELQRAGFTATLFVCPSVIDTATGLWFQVARALLPDESAVSALKQRTPAERAALVTDHPEVRVPQLTRADLDRWVEAGGTIGNHTWTHPLLDQEPPETVRAEIERTRDWIASEIPGHPDLFAYPNGNWCASADRALRELGYPMALLFDHAVARLDDPMRLSRIRVNADDPLARFSASVSGAHPAFHRLRAGLR